MDVRVKTIKKAECQRIHSFELWCWRRLLRVPWTARGSNESIPKGNQSWIFTGRTDAKFQYFGHLMWTVNSLEKTLMMGKIEGKRRKGWYRIRWSNDITHSVHMNLREVQEMVKDREAWCLTVPGVAKSQTWLGDWLATVAFQCVREVK